MSASPHEPQSTPPAPDQTTPVDWYPTGQQPAVPQPSVPQPFVPQPVAPQQVASPPPPSPGRRTGLIAAAAGGGAILVILLVAMALAIIYVQPNHSTEVAGPAASSGPKVGGGAGAHAGDLRDYLLKAPAGSSQTDLQVGKDGALSMADAVSISLDEMGNEQDLLESNGFVDGAVGAWTTSDDVDIIINLLRFDSREHAVNYFAVETSDVVSEFEAITRHYITAIPEAVTVGTSKADSDGYSYTASYAAVGDTVIFLLVDKKSDDPPSTDISDDIMTRQFAKL